MICFPKLRYGKICVDHGVLGKESCDFSETEDDQINLADRAERIGWLKAIKSAFPSKTFLNYVSGNGRLAILDAIPFDKRQQILEVGPGYGQMTGAIARKVAAVDAIEVDAEQARFCRIRLDQEGVDNVRIFSGGSEAILPYVDRSFDGVVMNLVLEWCAVQSSRPPAQVQRAYLAEIARVLRPGGFLFLSTKNRFSLRLLLGGRDEHMANMRFGSALPRAIGGLIMGRHRARGYLHSFNALRRKIEEAGFSIQTAYWAIPDMRWPNRLVPLDNASVRAAQRDSTLSLGGRYTHHLMKILPASWIKYVTPGLTFLVWSSSLP